MENYVTHDKKTKKHKAFQNISQIPDIRYIHVLPQNGKLCNTWQKKSKNIKHSMHISQIPDINRYIHVLPQNGKLCNT